MIGRKDGDISYYSFKLYLLTLALTRNKLSCNMWRSTERRAAFVNVPAADYVVEVRVHSYHRWSHIDASISPFFPSTLSPLLLSSAPPSIGFSTQTNQRQSEPPTPHRPQTHKINGADRQSLREPEEEITRLRSASHLDFTQL